MWHGRLGLPKVLFFALRYGIFLNSAFAFVYMFPKHLPPDACASRFTRGAISSTVLVLGAESILFLRVYAFSGRSRTMAAYLVIQFLAVHVTSSVVLVRFLRSMKCLSLLLPFRARRSGFALPLVAPLPIPNLTCMPVSADAKWLGIVFVILFAGASAVMSLMIVMAVRKHRQGDGRVFSGLVTLFYRDGVYYFICVSAVLCANISVSLAAPDNFKLHFTQIAVDMYTVLSTRMLLHLREWAERDGSEEFQLRGLSTLTTHGIEYSTNGRPPSPIEFEARELAAPMRST
ncbi:hypothetical protein FA13DRAFT_287914 [Coprinellus micaceus]|uniref:Uncharacterized protein n=1 Tax=Coprinellus micaceus TaxID=71717 RepID=A0A4Y7TDC6_COPMI|nr:hypothetical protein FA13DRAFT_287914 [Coprinellus micaceus]